VTPNRVAWGTPARLALFAGALAAAAAAPARSAAADEADAPPRCRIFVDLAPERAFVGEQVHYRIRILRRRDVHALEWHTALSFPTFRAEWLPGVASDEPLAQDGESWLEFLERRAIYPAHPGHLEIPEAALRCATVDGEEVVAVPSRSLEVDALPLEGQPAGFSGLLGPVTVVTNAREDRLALGETLHLTVRLEGETNVWAAPSPRAALESVPELDVFAHAGQLARDAGRTLRLRQYWTFDLVPRRAGTLRLPELRFAYFDPAERRYAEASAPGLAIAVGEAPARGPAPRPREVEEPEPRPALDARHVLLGLALTVGGLALLVRMARRGLRRRPSDALHLVLDRAREDMMETVYRRDPVGHANALAVGVREALGTRVLGAATASAEELLGLAPPTGPLRDAAYLLIQLDAIRFGGSGALPTMQEYRRVIHALAELPPLER